MRRPEAGPAQLQKRADYNRAQRSPSMLKIRLERVYGPKAKASGKRILVDRIWPRGVRKDALKLDLWLRELAPSTELRKWFGHDPQRWEEFKRRYASELRRPER